MRVTHLSTYDVHGGAARAAHRLHCNLLLAGCESTMLVRHGQLEDPHVLAVEPGRQPAARVRRRLRRWAIRRELSRARRRMPGWVENFCDDRSDVADELFERLPVTDVITLHWVVGLLDYERCLPALAAKAPLVWRLPDVNALTGGCVYPGTCTRYTSQCGACPQIGAEGEHDLSQRIFERKREAYERLEPHRLHFVALTRWMADCVRSSRLGSRFAVSVIPNGIDTEVFAPRDSAGARARLELPADSSLILFIAHDPTLVRKGLRELLLAIERIPVPDRPLLVTVGGREPVVTTVPHCHLGRVADDRLLSFVYSAADLVVVPSLEENLPNTALEAIACGVPVVAFDVGGIADLVIPGQTGLLAPARDDAALAAAIESILRAPAFRAELSVSCRRLATSEFDRRTQARRYMDLYESMLDSA